MLRRPRSTAVLVESRLCEVRRGKERLLSVSGTNKPCEEGAGRRLGALSFRVQRLLFHLLPATLTTMADQQPATIVPEADDDTPTPAPAVIEEEVQVAAEPVVVPAASVPVAVPVAVEEAPKTPITSSVPVSAAPQSSEFAHAALKKCVVLV